MPIRTEIEAVKRQIEALQEELRILEACEEEESADDGN